MNPTDDRTAQTTCSESYVSCSRLFQPRHYARRTSASVFPAGRQKGTTKTGAVTPTPACPRGSALVGNRVAMYTGLQLPQCLERSVVHGPRILYGRTSSWNYSMPVLPSDRPLSNEVGGTTCPPVRRSSRNPRLSSATVSDPSAPGQAVERRKLRVLLRR